MRITETVVLNNKDKLKITIGMSVNFEEANEGISIKVLIVHVKYRYVLGTTLLDEIYPGERELIQDINVIQKQLKTRINLKTRVSKIVDSLSERIKINAKHVLWQKSSSSEAIVVNGNRKAIPKRKPSKKGTLGKTNYI